MVPPWKLLTINKGGIMTTQEKLINHKLSLLELAEYLKNVSQACKINGVSRQHFYDIKKSYEEHGLKEKSRHKPSKKNRVASETE
jgi:transposase